MNVIIIKQIALDLDELLQVKPQQKGPSSGHEGGWMQSQGWKRRCGWDVGTRG